MQKLMYFLALFSYLNILCFEVKYCNFREPIPVHSNESLFEVLLENVLDVDHSALPEKLPEIIFDDYRVFGVSIALLPIVLFFTWLMAKIFVLSKPLLHPRYYSRAISLPGYYTFLYRYRPF